MRRLVTIAGVLALAGCGGGGGGSVQQPPPPTQSPVTQGDFATPQFTIVVPVRQNSAARSPQYVSSASLSVKITLTADSKGTNPTTIPGNPAITTITPGQCGPPSGCTIKGPPAPYGTDSFTVVTYDNTDPTNVSAHALNAGQDNNATITQGAPNTQSVILGAIPKTLAVSGVPTGAGALSAGHQVSPQTATLSVVAQDGHGDTIPTGQSPNVFYVDATGAPLNITLSDPDTNFHGSCVINTGTNTCVSGSATSVTFSGPDVTRVLSYDGLAELPVTLTASASGATNGTAIFQPKLNAPVFNGTPATPAGVAQTGSPEIDLFAASGTGSTGSEYFTEVGWTDSPYNNALTFANNGPCTSGANIYATSMADIATISVGGNSNLNGTQITATIVGSPLAGSCATTITDALSANTTDGYATLTVTYTPPDSIGVSGKRRR